MHQSCPGVLRRRLGGEELVVRQQYGTTQARGGKVDQFRECAHALRTLEVGADGARVMRRSRG
jgi:hypothetical protein